MRSCSSHRLPCHSIHRLSFESTQIVFIVLASKHDAQISRSQEGKSSIIQLREDSFGAIQS